MYNTTVIAVMSYSVRLHIKYISGNLDWTMDHIHVHVLGYDSSTKNITAIGLGWNSLKRLGDHVLVTFVVTCTCSFLKHFACIHTVQSMSFFLFRIEKERHMSGKTPD